MATNQDDQTLEQTLNKTDFGHIIHENRKWIMVIAALLILGIIGYSVNNQIYSSKNLVKLDLAFAVEQNIFKPYMEDKTKAAEFKTALTTINSDLHAQANLVPVFMAAINKLEAAGDLDESIISMANSWLGKLSKESGLYLFLALRVVALNEDANKLDQSISILEGLVGAKANLLKDKVLFDLGRLYMKKGDVNTANERFASLKENHKESEFNKLAKLYMSGL